MIEFENRINIDRPVNEVFSFVADFENVPRWNHHVLRVEKTTPGPIGIGTVFHQVRKSDEQIFSIIEFKHDHLISVATLPDCEPQFTMSFTFEAFDGSTELVDQWELETGRNRLVEMLGKPQIKAAMAENLEKLKELLEERVTQLQDGRLVVLLSTQMGTRQD